MTPDTSRPVSRGWTVLWILLIGAYLLVSLAWPARADRLSAKQHHGSRLLLVALATLDNPPMILNLGSKEVVSRYEFALMIANLLGLNAHFLHPVNKIEGWIAERPTKGGLKVKLAEKLGLPIYTIREGLLAWSG